MDKRYQVFVSSTYQDLLEERKEIIQALLELDCMPSGMELFPAANEDQWTLIQKVIDDSDYYLVVVAGRYGSQDSDDVSYTEKEYRYALQKGIPIIGFLHKEPNAIPRSKCETDAQKQAKLEQFRELVKSKMVKFWSTPQELGSIVSRSVVQLIKNHSAVGWVRADQVPDESSAAEIVRLRNTIDRLQEKLSSATTLPPPGTEHLASGSQEYTVEYYWEFSFGFLLSENSPWQSTNIQWDKIFYYLGPELLDEGTTNAIISRMRSLVGGLTLSVREDWVKKNTTPRKQLEYKTTHLTTTAVDSIVLQLRALGYITKSVRKRSLKDSQTYWTLTPFGDDFLTKLRAIRRSG